MIGIRKVCSICKNGTDFYNRPKNICKSCVKERTRKRYLENRDRILQRDREKYKLNPEPKKAAAQRWKAKNPRYKKDYDLKKTYGISLSKFEELKNDQKNRCAICKEITDLVVDHDHDNQIVRGLLCEACNFGLGKFKDNTSILSSAIAYLERWYECY